MTLADKYNYKSTYIENVLTAHNDYYKAKYMENQRLQTEPVVTYDIVRVEPFDVHKVNS
jgi:hypothetical protein